VDKVLILIPCSGCKEEGGKTIYNADSTILNHLSSQANKKLVNLRTQLFEGLGIPLGRDVGCNDSVPIYYMKAHNRYIGNLYSQISNDAWEKLRTTEELDIVIISALYGLLSYNESIRDYDIEMQSKIGHRLLKRWWRENGLPSMLEDYVANNGVTVVHSVLSNQYDDALRGSFKNIKIDYIVHNEFSKYGSGSNHHRGKWLNDFILKR